MRTKSFAPGRFCWADMAVPDVKRTIGFYTELLGWNVAPAGKARQGYTILRKGCEAAVGLYPMAQAQRTRKEKPHWLSYVCTDELERSSARIADFGGHLEVGPINVGSAGRSCVLSDPQGARLALWQPKEFRGAGIWNEPGAICWNELVAMEAEPSWRFYARLLAWEANDQKRSDGDYTLFKLDDQNLAGLRSVGSRFQRLVNQWVIYFAVSDCDSAVAAAVRMGAATLVPPTSMAEMGRVAIIEDPAGAPCGLVGQA